MKFNSAVSDLYKINLIHCLFDRARKICSSYSSLTVELDKLMVYFSQNRYPQRLVKKIFQDKLDISLTKPVVSGPERKKIFISFPFMSNRANKDMSKEIREIITKFFPQLKLQIIFNNSFKISNFFSFKDHIPISVSSNVVYLYNCGQCSAQYCGETTRHLKTRVAEHRGVSPRTGVTYKSPVCSNVRDHAVVTGHDINFENFTVLHRTDSYNLRLAESILIHKLKPNLNGMDSSIPLNILR